MGAVKEHNTTLGGRRYRCKTFPASEGLLLLPRLISLAGEKVLRLFMESGDEGASALSQDPKVRSAVLVHVCERAEANDGLLVLRDLLRHTVWIREHKEPGGKPVHVDELIPTIFDEHFAGDYGHLLEVCVWVARVSFGGP